MRSTFAAIAIGCLGAFTPAVLRSAELANGIYELAPEGAGIMVTRSYGGEIGLGKRLSDNFGQVSMWSTSNENDRFRVFMQQAGPFVPEGQFAIYIDGVCEMISSHTEPDANGKTDLIADVAGHENARRVAAALGVDPQERTHPGHLLLVTWTPVRESYKLGEAVVLELKIKNVGKTTIRFMEGGQQRGARDNQFGFTAFAGSGSGEPIPDTGDPTNFGGLAAFRELKPGEVFTKQVDIAKWFKFERPDSYQITGIYELELATEEFGARALWDEYATGRCRVKIGSRAD